MSEESKRWTVEFQNNQWTPAVVGNPWPPTTRNYLAADAVAKSANQLELKWLEWTRVFDMITEMDARLRKSADEQGSRTGVAVGETAFRSRVAKNPQKGKCVHCLKDPVDRTWDHMFPKAWYPDTTPENLEKWQIPSCLECNQRLGKLENDLIGRIALTLDAKNPASKGLAEKALRAINPAEARDEGDAAAREARGKKILGEMFKGEQIKSKNIVPGLGERWGSPAEQQVAIRIPDESFPAITEKIVRGLAFREEGVFIEPPQEIECHLANEEGLDDLKELLAKHGKEFKREPGLVIRRANLDGGDLYEITFWDQFKTYAAVLKPQTPAAT